jgi:hypothetical protein
MKLFSQEVLRVILLDTRYRHSSTVEITKASINESLAHPRDIFRQIIGQSAYAFVLLHNLWVATHSTTIPQETQHPAKLIIRTGYRGLNIWCYARILSR